MSLYKLPDEILLILFNYCNADDLFQLSDVCERFYNIATELLIKKSNNLLVTGQKSEKFRERCQPLVSSYRKKFFIYDNWKRGSYQSNKFCSESQSSNYHLYKNRLQLTKENVISFVNYYDLCAFNRTKYGLVSDDNVIVAKCCTEILDIFVPRNDIIVTLHKDGSIRQWTIKSLDGRKYFYNNLLHSSCSNLDCSYNVMDVTPQNIVISVKNMGEIQLWKYIPEENSIMDKHIILDLSLNPTESFTYSITFDPTGTKFVAGIFSSAELDKCFKIYDINKCCTEMHFKTDYSDLDLLYASRILWKGPNDIFSLSRDKVVKMDVRTHKVVQKWYAPFEFTCYRDERLTCMSTDNQYAIMTGSSLGKVILWDERQSDFIQVYDKEYVGRVKCLQFDSSRMYIAADYGMYEFDFTTIFGLEKSSWRFVQ